MANYNLTQTGDEVQAYIDSIPVIDVTGTLSGSTITFDSNPYSQIAANYAAECGSVLRLTVAGDVYVIRITGYDSTYYTGSVFKDNQYISVEIGELSAQGMIEDANAVALIPVTGTESGGSITLSSNPFTQVQTAVNAGQHVVVRVTIASDIIDFTMNTYSASVATYIGTANFLQNEFQLICNASTATITNRSTSNTFTTGESVPNVGIDATPTQGSNNLVTSGGVYPLQEAVLSGISPDIDVTPSYASGYFYTTTDGAALRINSNAGSKYSGVITDVSTPPSGGIDVSNYIGRTIKVTVATIVATSLRETVICNESHIVVASVKESAYSADGTTYSAELVVPEGAKWFYWSGTGNLSSVVIKGIAIAGVVEKVEEELQSINDLITELNEVMPHDVGWSDLTSLAELRLGSYNVNAYGVGGNARLHCVSYLPEPYITNISATKLRITMGSDYRYGRQLLSSTFPYSSGKIYVGTAELFNDSAWQQGTTEKDLTGYPTAVTFGFVVKRSDNGAISPSDDIGLVVELYGESGWVSIEDAIDARVSPIEQTVEDLYGAPVEYSLPNIGSTLARGQFATTPNHHYTIKVTPWDITGVVSTGQWIIVFEDGSVVIDGSKSPEPIHEEYNFIPTQSVIKVSTRGVVGTVAKMEIIDNDAGVVNQLNIRVGVLEDEVNSDGEYDYVGEKINLQQRTYNKESYLVTNSNDLTTIKATIVTEMGHSLIMQSCAVFGKYFVRAYQYGGIAIYDLETKTLVSNFMLPLPTADLETLHASNISFGVEYPSGNTTFPAFYVCETTGQRRCFVFNLTLSAATLIQTITFSGTWGTGNDYRDFIVDAQNRCMWIIGYYNYGASGNYSIFKKVDLRAISSATITYSDADVQQSFDLHEITVIQGVFIWNDRMYLGDQRRYIVNIDLIQGKIVGYVDFSAFMGELEGLTTYDNSLLVDNSTVYKLTLF